MGQAGARESVKQLFDLYGDQIYGYARYTLYDPADADDVLQETFLQALRSWDKFEHRSAERTWLWSIARHCIAEANRRRGRDRRHLVDGEVTLSGLSVRDSTVLLELEDSLRRLPPKQRQVFVLRVVQDLTTAEVARITGWPEIRVRVTLYRAIRQIRQMFTTDD